MIQLQSADTLNSNNNITTYPNVNMFVIAFDLTFLCAAMMGSHSSFQATGSIMPDNLFGNTSGLISDHVIATVILAG